MATKVKASSLRARAIEAGPMFDSRKQTWMDLLDKTHPQEAEELRELISDWVGGDRELRAVYPSARMLTKFILTLPYVTIGATTLRNYIESRQDEAKR